MSDFRKLNETMMASPQLSVSDVNEAAERGVELIINNRPDGEAEDQISGAEIAAAAESAGMQYRAIPINHAGFSLPQVEEMVDALASTDGRVLAYCRSGTRSTLLWALAQARLGADIQSIAEAAAAAGYDISPVRPAMESIHRPQES